MLKAALWVLVGFVAGFAASSGAHELMHGVKVGKEKRFISDISAVRGDLEAFRAAHNGYPAVCDPKGLVTELGARSSVSLLGEQNFQYCSDGAKYVLAYLPFGGGSYVSDFGAPLVLANNELVAFPKANTSIPPPAEAGGRP